MAVLSARSADGYQGAGRGFSGFLSRFTHSEELVWVTLAAYKENVDFSNLTRNVGNPFGDLLSTNYGRQQTLSF